MDPAGIVFGVLFWVALLVGIPIWRQRIKENRIRREWRARGMGYAEGKHAVVPQYLRSHEAAADIGVPPNSAGSPLTPPRVHDSAGFQLSIVAIGAIALAGVAWMVDNARSHHADPPAGVTVTADTPKAKPHKKAKRRVDPAVQQYADATCLATGSVPATDGKCYAPRERMPRGVSRRTATSQDVSRGTKPLPDGKDAP